jgi:glycosyltransferase involved in cell wall biosynthesis
MKEVSIIIPTFNRAELLPESIDSSLAQTHKCEVIVCDHGSTDNTREIVESYGNKVIYIRREKDFGPHYCWLEGLMNATTEIVHFQFDDDLIDPDYIERTKQFLQKDVGFVFSGCEVFYPDNKRYRAFLDKFPEGIVASKDAEKFLLKNMLSPGCILLRKRDAIDALYQGTLPFSTDHYHGVGPDNFFSLLCLLRYENIGYVNAPLAKFRYHDCSITINANNDNTTGDQILKAYAEVVKYYKILKKVKQQCY